jgi:hypothetical protein
MRSAVRILRTALRYDKPFLHMQTINRFLQNAQMAILPGVNVYPHRLVFIAAMPKSGSTWLENLVGSIPGYRRLAYYDPKGLLTQHILDPALLEHVPARGNFFIKTHVEARPEGVDALRRHNVPTVVLVRDLRDQCVSRFYHVLNLPSHRHHDLYANGERAESFTHCVNVCVNDYADWIRGWVKVTRDDDRFALVRYEDMRENIKAQFLRVIERFDIEIADDKIDRIIEEVAAKSKLGSDLETRLKQGNTLRSGRVGDWRSHFSPADVKLFKEKANDTLVWLGYEKDDKW